MQITKVLEGDVLPTPKIKIFTDIELQNEFDFILLKRSFTLCMKKG